jgi:hypothetical protein
MNAAVKPRGVLRSRAAMARHARSKLSKGLHMTSPRKILSAALLGAGLALSPVSQQTLAGIAVGTGATEPPPPLRREVVAPHPPHPHWVWIGGHWNRAGGKWIWVRGYWSRPPHAGAMWVPGWWVARPHGYIWIAGHWR